MSTVKILSILEAASIEPRQARAIAECLELAVEECRGSVPVDFSDVSQSPSVKEIYSDLRTAIIEAKTDILRWMFILWIAQIFATAALLKLL